MLKISLTPREGSIDVPEMIPGIGAEKAKSECDGSDGGDGGVQVSRGDAHHPPFSTVSGRSPGEQDRSRIPAKRGNHDLDPESRR